MSKSRDVSAHFEHVIFPGMRHIKASRGDPSNSEKVKKCLGLSLGRILDPLLGGPTGSQSSPSWGDFLLASLALAVSAVFCGTVLRIVLTARTTLSTGPVVQILSLSYLLLRGDLVIAE